MNGISHHTHPKKGSGKFPLRVYLAYGLVCTLLLTGVSFCRYLSHSHAQSSARVAKGLVTVDYELSDAALSMGPPSGSDEYFLMDSFPFTVSNNTSEVAIRYDVVVTLDHPLGNGLFMYMYAGDDSLYLTPTDDSNLVFTALNAGTFAAGTDSSQLHTLYFTGYFKDIPKGTQNYAIQIDVHAQQID